jgi:ABC-2 type transport system ATP-binding protein
MENAIVINNLVKSYHEVKAVRGISFEVHKGEMFGLVGPDGAGKTTTLRVLCGLLVPDSGDLTIFDIDLKKHKRKVQKNIGYLSQRFSLYGDLTVDENIEFFADIHGVRNFEERRNELLDFTRLRPFRDRMADNLSGGMKQKLALACSLIHRPKIIFLDEPTTGVDPVSRRDFWKILSSLIREGITIFMSTPYLDEAERCNRVALMNKGEIMSIDTPKKIRESIHKEIIEIVSPKARTAYKLIQQNMQNEVQLFGDRINIVVDNYESEYTKIETLLNKHDVKIESSRRIPPSLENVFIHLVKKAG